RPPRRVRGEGRGALRGPRRRSPRARRPRARRLPGREEVNILGWSFSAETIVLGLLSGLTYAVLAAGLVLVYRATKVINFAHGELGAFGGAVLAKLVLDDHWNFWLALVAVLVLGGALGALVELAVVRRLFRAPR